MDGKRQNKHLITLLNASIACIWGEKRVRLPEELLHGRGEAIDCLLACQVGFPVSAAPNFLFSYIGQGVNGEIKIGYDRDEQVIALCADGSLVVLMENFLLPVNHNLLCFYLVLFAYAEMIENAIAETDDSVFVENRIPPALINKLKKKLEDIDGGCCATGNFWGKEIARLQCRDVG